ncbi:F-box protein [Melia azedarach]|uniref:F-box protein n=1 Tax=Melia azedarach TaxID=155640 RepID=A0ACC1XRS8_MELAZ|nr:F-box protein [Melia azedarach]
MMTDNGDSLEETLIEILAKLPVKSLLRLRCVCKSWYTIIKDPIFINKHLNNDKNIRLIVTYCKGVEKQNELQEAVYPDEFFGLYSDETLEHLSLIDLDPLKPIIGSLWGPYCGIFCIIGITNLVSLWNLATQESRTLPKLAVLSQNTNVHSTDVGFGLDLMTNDYKLVLIMTFWDEKRNLLCESCHVAVYTLGNNSWREFECFKSFHYYLPWLVDNTVYWNGACYWLLELKDDNNNLILSFHLGEEEFQEVEGPRISKSAKITLGIHGEFLSLLVLDTMVDCFEIWVMEKRNWIKQLTLGPFTAIHRPLKFWKKGGFFVESDFTQLLLYEPSTGEMRDFELKCYWFGIDIYNESLVTIKGGDNLSNE